MLAVTCVAQNQALLGLEPVHRGGEAEDAEVAGRGLLVPGRDRAPFLEPAPETFDEVAVVVDVVGAGHGRLVPPGRDRGPCAAVPDQLAEGVRAVAAIADDPQRHAGELVEEPGRQRQLVRLARGQREGDRAAPPVGDHARLGAEAAARAAERLAPVPFARGPPFLGAPAALGCALIEVPSRNAMPSSTPRACAASSSRCHAPSLDQRMKSWAARHQGPSSAGIARHFAPFACRQTIASTVRRRSRGGVLPFGRHASKSGSSAAHRSSVNTTGRSRFRPCRATGGDRPQALTGPRRRSPAGYRLVWAWRRRKRTRKSPEWLIDAVGWFWCAYVL